MHTIGTARRWLLGLAAFLAVAALVLAFSACEEEEEAPTTPTATVTGTPRVTGTATPAPAGKLVTVRTEDVTLEGAPAPTVTEEPVIEPGPLKIGLLLDYTGDLAEFGTEMENGAKLAVKHVNAAGGILGQPVQLIKADSATNPQVGVSEATTLVNVQGVQAIVGSLASGVTLAIAEGVTIPNEIVLISPASTSPALSTVADNDFLFRTTISDAAQGIILAELAEERGFKKVSTLYTNNAYGQGLSDQFKASFTELGYEVPATVSHEQEQTSYLSELQKAVAGKPDALVAISYPVSASVYLKEAIENKLIDTFLFVDGTKSLDIITAVGIDALEGTYGTAPGTSETEASKTFDDEYKADFGELPPLPFIRETYDAVIVIALAAAKAGSTDPGTIRNVLREVAGPPGEKVGPGAAGIAKALQLISAGTDINYEGAVGSQDFDGNGDVVSGAIEIWKIER